MDMRNLYKLEYDRQHKDRNNALLKTAEVIGIFLIALTISLTAHAEEETIAVIYTEEYMLKELNSGVTEVGIAPGAGQCTTEETAETSTQINTNEYSSISMTEEEYELLRRIVAAEAQTQSLEGRKAVVEVIFNRVLSEKYPSSIYGVLSQKGQFATWKMRNAKWVEPKYADKAIAEVLEQGRTVLPSTKYVYFDTKGRNGKAHIKIGAHYFGR